MGSRSAVGPDRAALSVTERLGHAFRVIRVGIVALAVVLGLLFAYLLLWVRPQFSRYAAAFRGVQLGHQAMIDQETGLRGYLLLRDESLLAPYRSGVRAQRAANERVAAKVGTDERAAPLVVAMRVAEQAWTSEWALDVADDRAPTEGSALEEFVERGKELFDRYRVAEGRLYEHVVGRRDDLQSLEDRALVLGLAAVVAVAAVGYVAERQRRQLGQLLAEPVTAVVAATESIAAGRLETRIEPDGPSEIRRIGASVNAMAEVLREAAQASRARSDRLEEQREQLRRILGMAREIAGSLSLPYVLRAVGTSARQLSGFARVRIWLAEEDRPHAFGAVHDTWSPEGTPQGAGVVEVGVGVIGHAVKFGRTSTEVAEGEPVVEVHADRPLRNLAVPLIVGAQVTGAIEFTGEEPAQLGDGDLEMLETLAIHAAAAIEAARLHGHTEALGKTDALTGLANRRSLDADLSLECERAARYHRPLALIMFDVDHFKRFNDTHGHQRGDEILFELAIAVRSEMRSTDSAYRYGGEEFAVLARESSHDSAAVLAERLRRRIEEHFAAVGSVEPVTASFGVGFVPPEPASPDALIAAADAALYRAKANGRNRVEVSSGPR